MGHPVGLVPVLISRKQPIEIHIKEWPEARTLMGTERIGAWVHINQACHSVFYLLKGTGHLVGHPNTLRCITTDSSHNGDPWHTWASAAKTPSNDCEFVP
jgi:hypothetical protein